ncbi:hypothetical protein IV203_017001 [Nitzschia inconspicua]|uniref:Uncharacterized protein n=1 Tax=Nitzschia inconspicua TaxID=303405 RepID=A0A9K3PIT4_9STRA|nr:hypothetical protein IV203_017001 [Nitzschia inconspicua]
MLDRHHHGQESIPKSTETSLRGVARGSNGYRQDEHHRKLSLVHPATPKDDDAVASTSSSSGGTSDSKSGSSSKSSTEDSKPTGSIASRTSRVASTSKSSNLPASGSTTSKSSGTTTTSTSNSLSSTGGTSSGGSSTASVTQTNSTSSSSQSFGENSTSTNSKPAVTAQSTDSVVDDILQFLDDDSYKNSTTRLFPKEMDEPAMWPVICSGIFITAAAILCATTAYKNYRKRKDYQPIPTPLNV